MANPVQPHRGTILPSIDGLIGLIESNRKSGDAEEERLLREMCLRKIRSYPIEAYAKRYTNDVEQQAARARWNEVRDFANRRRDPAAG